MSQAADTTPPSLLDFTYEDLVQHYPSLPQWAISAFAQLQRPQTEWKPEARALLNIAGGPSGNYRLHDRPACEEEQAKASEERDLLRLSRDLIAAKDEGWSQWKAQTTGIAKIPRHK